MLVTGKPFPAGADLSTLQKQSQPTPYPYIWLFDGWHLAENR
jgi:hypothetical protein